MNALGEQLAQVEQKLDRGGDGGGEEAKSIGERFTDDEGVKTFMAEGGPRGGKADLRVKATLTSADHERRRVRSARRSTRRGCPA